jgi:hypothetical protein
VIETLDSSKEPSGKETEIGGWLVVFFPSVRDARVVTKWFDVPESTKNFVDGGTVMCDIEQLLSEGVSFN